MIISIFGQPGTGKTTLARYIKFKFAQTALYLGYEDIMHIDGDELRKILKNQDYTRNGRTANITMAHGIAEFFAEKNIVPILSLVNPYQLLRNQLSEKRFVIEIYLSKDDEDIRGKETFNAPFEAPVIFNDKTFNPRTGSMTFHINTTLFNREEMYKLATEYILHAHAKKKEITYSVETIIENL